MDWKTCAVDDLRRYNQIKIGIINLQERLRIINKSIKHRGTTSNNRRRRMDSDIINALVEGERLQRNITSAESLAALVERGLGSLSDEEKKVLQRFYMSNAPVSSRVLAAELGYEPRTLYRLRERALEKFTLAMYGMEIS